VPELGDPQWETFMLQSLMKLELSLSVANPAYFDCPLIGCSTGFEKMTGYSKSEIHGMNCRFLNQGLTLDMSARLRLREAATYGHEFIGVLTNVRKTGESFLNLLHMCSLTVGGHVYIIGVQADVTEVGVDFTNAIGTKIFRSISEQLFNEEIGKWIQQQAKEFSMRVNAPNPGLVNLIQNMIRSCVPTTDDGESILDSPDPSNPLTANMLEGLPPGAFFFDTKLDPSADTSGDAASIDTFVTPPAPEADESACRGEPEAGRPIHTSVPEGANQPQEQNPAAQAASATNGHALSADVPTHPLSESAAGGEILQYASIGSRKHPDNCVECQHYFFALVGCKNGESCDFCHEAHPRKNQRKNRKFMNMIVAGGKGVSLGAEASITDIASMHYTKDDTRNLRPSEPPKPDNFTHIVGQRTSLPAWVKLKDAPDAGCHVPPANLLFTVTPALPEGLTIEPYTGRIVGIASMPKARSAYCIAVYERGKSTTEAAESPITSCTIMIRVKAPTEPAN